MRSTHISDWKIGKLNRNGELMSDECNFAVLYEKGGPEIERKCNWSIILVVPELCLNHDLVPFFLRIEMFHFL